MVILGTLVKGLGADQVIWEQVPSVPDLRSGNRSHAPARNCGGSAEEQWLYAPLGAADRPAKNGKGRPKAAFDTVIFTSWPRWVTMSGGAGRTSASLSTTAVKTRSGAIG